MGFKCGLIGLPNVGKSTLFNILTESNVSSENYPFCTIKPNSAFVPVQDNRLMQLQKIVRSKLIIPNTIEFVDIAGLVKNAHKGEGLGNQFLQNIKDVDALVHVVRCFINQDIIHFYDSINPIRDISVINLELIYADINTCTIELKKINNNLKKNVFFHKKTVVLNKCLMHLKQKKMLKDLILNQEELKEIKILRFLTIKPVMYIANIGNNLKETVCLKELERFCNRHDAHLVKLNIFNNNTLHKNINDNDLITINNYRKNIINKIISTGFQLLKLNTFFTVGIKQIKAWTIEKEKYVTEAARKIHSDLKKGFIRAQVISFNDFITCKGELGAKKTGKYRTEGRKYIVQDGDIIHILFNI
ncbi:Ribosome-binding ATPase YchF [Buchnera aphidicola (Thelaxes suberi)]|uniref:redox-regulated ATPase YchF n=1 Tax=Buchnera aphidicola TaxID=9 RepID=UPI003463CB02